MIDGRAERVAVELRRRPEDRQLLRRLPARGSAAKDALGEVVELARPGSRPGRRRPSMVLMIGESDDDGKTDRRHAALAHRLGHRRELAAAEAHRDQVAGVAVDVDRRAVDLRHRRHHRQAEERARRHQGTARDTAFHLGAMQLVAPAVGVGRDPPGAGEAQLAGAKLQRLVGEDLDHGQPVGGHAARAAAGLGHQQEMIGGRRRQRRERKARELDGLAVGAIGARASKIAPVKSHRQSLAGRAPPGALMAKMRALE